MVFRFTVTGEVATAIEMIADPDSVAALELELIE